MRLTREAMIVLDIFRKFHVQAGERLRSITDDQSVKLAELFRLMGDASRLKIVVACLSRPRCVSDIASETRLSPSLVSHHLKLLRATRMLRADRQGKQVFYVATDEHVRCVITDMVAHIAEVENGEPEGR